MRQLDERQALEIIQRHQAGGMHVDARLVREIGRPGKLFLLPLANADEFYRLVWQSIGAVRPLAPIGAARTIRDCASRLAQFEWRFEALVEAGYEWFQRCVEIDRGFTYERFGWMALTPLVSHEMCETPEGTYYVYDGAHKSIVLAKKLLRRELAYATLEALVLTPRRS